MHIPVHPIYSVSLENPAHYTWVWTTLPVMLADQVRSEDVTTICHSARLLGTVGFLCPSSSGKVSLSEVDTVVRRYEAHF